jgi:hypothetical protein
MKRRTFLKRSSIGLSALVAGVTALKGAPGAPSGSGRVYGVPDSVKPRTPLEHNLLRLSMSHADLPPEAWQDVTALSLLAQDVFDNPGVAQSFSRDPAAYLKAVGLDDVRLDPEAIEVKVALALGDPDVRDAIDREDPRAFVQALETRGLIRSPQPSQLAERIGAQLESLRSQQGGSFSPEACSVLAICIAAVWIWVAVVQDAVVAVAVAAAVSVYAYVLVSTSVAGGGGGGRRRRTAVMLQDRPSFKLAGALGGRDFGDRVAETFVEDNVEKIAAAVESLEPYRKAGALSPDRLRHLVRAQMLRQLQGHGADFAAARP